MNVDTERAMMEVYDELVGVCTNLRRVGSDPVISLNQRNRLMAMADGVNLAITHVVEKLRDSRGEVIVPDGGGSRLDRRVR
jgi:hypothetical protein